MSSRLSHNCGRITEMIYEEFYPMTRKMQASIIVFCEVQCGLSTLDWKVILMNEKPRVEVVG